MLSVGKAHHTRETEPVWQTLVANVCIGRITILQKQKLSIIFSIGFSDNYPKSQLFHNKTSLSTKLDENGLARI